MITVIFIVIQASSMDRYGRFLERFCSELETKDYVRSLTLHGSYATGEFTPGYSDIDYFLVIDSWSRAKARQIVQAYENSLDEKIAQVLRMPNILTMGEVKARVTEEMGHALIKAIIMDTRKVALGEDIYAGDKFPSIKEMKPWAAGNTTFHNVTLRRRSALINGGSRRDYFHNLCKIFKTFTNHMIIEHDTFVANTRYDRVIATGKELGLGTSALEKVLAFRRQPDRPSIKQLGRLYEEVCALSESFEEQALRKSSRRGAGHTGPRSLPAARPSP